MNQYFQKEPVNKLFFAIPFQISRATVVAGLVLVVQTGVFGPLGSLFANIVLRYGRTRLLFNGIGFIFHRLIISCRSAYPLLNRVHCRSEKRVYNHVKRRIFPVSVDVLHSDAIKYMTNMESIHVMPYCLSIASPVCLWNGGQIRLRIKIINSRRLVSC